MYSKINLFSKFFNINGVFFRVVSVGGQNGFLDIITAEPKVILFGMSCQVLLQIIKGDRIKIFSAFNALLPLFTGHILIHNVLCHFKKTLTNKFNLWNSDELSNKWFVLKISNLISIKSFS